MRMTQGLSDLMQAPLLKKKSYIENTKDLSILRQMKILDKTEGVREICENRIRQIEREISSGESVMETAKRSAEDIKAAQEGKTGR